MKLEVGVGFMALMTRPLKKLFLRLSLSKHQQTIKYHKIKTQDDHNMVLQGEEKCGECGEVYSDLKSHMYGVHGGFMSVLILQTVR